MTRKDVVKNQHIVPMVHLKSFLGNGQKKLECLNVKELRIEKSQSLKRICSAHFHYSKTAGELDEYGQSIEEVFAFIESWYGGNKNRIERKLLNKEVLTDMEKHELSFVISNLLFRGYKHREETLRSLRDMMGQITDGLDKDTKINGLSQEDAYTEIKKTSYATEQSLRIGPANALTHKKWQILINNSQEYPFMTSDEPVVEYVPNIAKEWPMFSTGFVVMTQVFHLSPRIAIIITFEPEKRGQWEFTDVTNIPKRIMESNLKYINNAHKYAYSNSSDFFRILIDFEKGKLRGKKEMHQPF